MSPEWVLLDGDDVHLESGLAYTAMCGETFHRDDADRDRFDRGEHSSARRCDDCNRVALENSDDRRAVK